MPPEQIARYIIAFSWLYHGIFPKLLYIDPLEQVMTASLGFSDEISYLITKSAGIGELVFALVFLFFYKNRTVVFLNIAGLMALLIFVIIAQPQLLLGAFNPVTTNIPLIGLSFILLKDMKKSH